MTVYLHTIQIMKSETEELPFPFELKSVCSAKKMPNGLSERTVVIDITTHGPLDFQSPKKSPLAKTDGLGRKLRTVYGPGIVVRKGVVHETHDSDCI